MAMRSASASVSFGPVGDGGLGCGVCGGVDGVSPACARSCGAGAAGSARSWAESTQLRHVSHIVAKAALLKRRRKHPSRAKALIDLATFAARLKSCTFTRAARAESLRRIRLMQSPPQQAY